VLLSLTILICDSRYHCFTTVRSILSVIAAPIQYAVNWPAELVTIIHTNFTTKHALQDENVRLKANALILQGQLQRLNFLEQENAKLRTLLSSASKIQTKVLAAQILDAATDNFSQQVTLNKGKRDGLYQGQPILDAYGVMGQVILVGPLTSKALLITDAKSAVPVTIVRTGMRAIVIGMGHSDELELANVPETADIKPGDFLVTSNSGQRFPEGHPVGTVKNVQHISGERFMRIAVAPSAHIGSSQHVLLIWNESSGKTTKK
jgi:rod shape-determining protein MreC